MRTEYRRLCASKASRANLAKQIAALAAEYGAACETRPAPLDDRDLYIDVKLGAHAVHMSFSGSSHVGAFLGHWHTDRDARFPDYFDVTIGGTLNRFHYGKATTCEETFAGFIESLRRGLADLRERQLIEKHGLPADAFDKGRAAYARKAIDAFRA